MARKRDKPCAGGCGALLWGGGPGGLPNDQVMCRQCRGFSQRTHGTGEYRRGCRCEVCRGAMVSRAARYRALRRAAFVEDVDPMAVFERDRWTCHLCRRRLSSKHAWPHLRAATVDHLVPLSLGGTHEMANVKTACFSCNCAKGNRGGNEQLLLIG